MPRTKRDPEVPSANDVERGKETVRNSRKKSTSKTASVEVPAEPVLALPAPDTVVTELAYPTLKIEEWSTATKKGPLTPERWKRILWWETEKEYQERMVALYPDTKPERWSFGDDGPIRDDNGQHQPIHCLDTNKMKVVCWNNTNNRSFDDGWCKDLTHTILNFQWTGPHTLPGETVNGETVRISRRGIVLSGQHQGTACILADEQLQQAREWATKNKTIHKYPHWDGHDHLFIETIVITGLSDDPRVLMSVDYVRPRTVADMLFTMDLFRDANSVERKELTRMLASAIDMLWDRTATKGYKTHHEVVGFLDRHGKLMDCVRHLFSINRATEEKIVDGEVIPAQSGRRISVLRISAGQCAAMQYLMASSGPATDRDAYRDERPPSEKNLDWTYWRRSEEFWILLAGNERFIPVRQALGRLKDSTPGNDDNVGMGGLISEKLTILAGAWERFKDHPESAGPPFPLEKDGDIEYYPDLEEEGCLWLSYGTLDDNGDRLPDTKVKLLDVADFFGIDFPDSVGKGSADKNSEPTPPDPTKEEIERATEYARKRREANKKKAK